MKIWSRKSYSQRRSRLKPVKFFPNFGGQGGSQQLTFITDEGWMVVEFDSIEEVRELMSQAATIHFNYRNAA